MGSVGPIPIPSQFPGRSDRGLHANWERYQHCKSDTPPLDNDVQMEWGGPCCQTGTRPGGTASLRAPTQHDRCIGNAHNFAAAQPYGKKWESPGASFMTHCAMKEDPLGPCRHPSCLGPTPVGSPLDPPQDFGVFIPRLSIRDISPRLRRRHFEMAGDPVMSLIC